MTTHQIAKRAGRYGLALAGPLVGAGGQFALSLVVLQRLTPDNFGTFSFILIATQLTTGLSSALLCAPYAFHMSKTADTKAASATFLSANLCLSLFFSTFFLGLALSLTGDLRIAFIYAAYAGILLLRWFARAYFYYHRRPSRTIVSDCFTGIVLCVAAVVLTAQEQVSLTDGAASLLISAIAGLVATGPRFLRYQFTSLSLNKLMSYYSIWRDQSRWSVLGVLTNEMTANAHAYMVTIMASPGAFAPLAASGLLIRPMGLTMNALGDFERPIYADHIFRHDVAQLKSSRLWLQCVLWAVWLANISLAAALILYFPSRVMPSNYDASAIILATGIWFAICASRVARASGSIELQAAGEFRVLASASLISSVVSVMLVPPLTFFFSPIWSLAGILVGEVVFAASVIIKARAWRRGWADAESSIWVAMDGAFRVAGNR